MNYSTIIVMGKLHVICDNIRSLNSCPSANYMNTGKALCGILKVGETVEMYSKIRKERIKRLLKINYRLSKKY